MEEQLTKDQLWLKMCEAGASIMVRCSKAQYFSYVVDEFGRVRGCGYNGTPSGMKNCTSGGCPRATSGCQSGAPYDHGPGVCFANHAEHNAIAGIDRIHLVRSTLYVNGVCCFNCAKEIAGSGIQRVVGIRADPLPGDFELTQRVFEAANVKWAL